MQSLIHLVGAARTKGAQTFEFIINVIFFLMFFLVFCEQIDNKINQNKHSGALNNNNNFHN